MDASNARPVVNITGGVRNVPEGVSLEKITITLAELLRVEPDRIVEIRVREWRWWQLKKRCSYCHAQMMPISVKFKKNPPRGANDLGLISNWPDRLAWCPYCDFLIDLSPPLTWD